MVIDGRRLHLRSVDESGLMLHFFGEDGSRKLDLAAFNAFLQVSVAAHLQPEA